MSAPLRPCALRPCATGAPAYGRDLLRLTSRSLISATASSRRRRARLPASHEVRLRAARAPSGRCRHQGRNRRPQSASAGHALAIPRTNALDQRRYPPRVRHPWSSALVTAKALPGDQRRGRCCCRGGPGTPCAAGWAPLRVGERPEMDGIRVDSIGPPTPLTARIREPVRPGASRRPTVAFPTIERSPASRRGTAAGLVPVAVAGVPIETRLPGRPVRGRHWDSRDLRQTAQVHPGLRERRRDEVGARIPHDLRALVGERRRAPSAPRGSAHPATRREAA